ncbi:hypothetical protein AAFF_G00018210 [Aldrovandia affinis]|uniref:Uncharacterized protein n=1 Tax=Aldrovandia affinis TaxID=143900 RepID=A0AAD7S5Y3_9TELE|nr:hypothetical protein AAFF_G00018210 [Aldrovandia affinis]
MTTLETDFITGQCLSRFGFFARRNPHSSQTNGSDVPASSKHVSDSGLRSQQDSGQTASFSRDQQHTALNQINPPSPPHPSESRLLFPLKEDHRSS